MVRFDKYRVDGKVGAGGLADVFRGALVDIEGAPENLEVGQAVALKVLRDPTRSPASLRRFLREGDLLQSLVHPGLPKCYEVVDGARPFLVLELLEGEGMNQALKRGPMPAEVLEPLAITLLETLAWLHARGVVHRDVKAANVFLCSDGRVLLLDLGMAVRRREERGPSGVMGTYAYMAPEQIAGAAVDQRTDLYALGVTLYEALAGLRPYRARGAAGYLEAHLAAEPRRALPEQTPERLAHSVLALMARDPAHRPQTASLALAQLTGVRGRRVGLHEPPLIARQAALGAIEGLLDHGSGAVHIVGERGSGLGRMAREAWSMAQGREITVAGLRALGRAELIERTREPAEFWIIEDVQRASATELRWLQELSVHTPLLTTGTSAPAVLAGRVVKLRDLNVEEVQELIEGLLGTPQVPPGQTEKLATFTKGLPGAVISTLRDFVDRGALRQQGQGPGGVPRWRMVDAVPMGRDNSLTRLYGARLSALDLDARALLEVLAVVREPLPTQIAQQVTGLAPSSVSQWRLVRDHLVVRRKIGGREALQVARPALAALVGRELSPERHRAIHQAVLGALERIGNPPEVAPVRAWCQAHGSAQVDLAESLVRLGERLVRRGRVPLAHEIVLRASYTQPLAPAIAVRVALSRSRCLMAEARPDEARVALEAASDLMAGRQSSGLSLARAEHCLHIGSLTDATAHARTAMEIGKQRAGLEAGLILAQVNAFTGQRKAAARACREVLSQAPEGSLGARAHQIIGGLLLAAGRLGDAARHLRLCARWHRRVRSPLVVSSLLGLAEALRRAGAVDDAATALRAAKRSASQGGLYPLRLRVAAARARFALAVAGPRQAQEILDGCPMLDWDKVSLLVRGEWGHTEILIRMAAQDPAAALAACNRVRQDAELSGWHELAAFSLGIESVLRGQGEGLLGAVKRLDALGARRSLGRLLLEAGRMERDAAVLRMAVPEARRASDAFLLLEALQAQGDPQARQEALPLVQRVLIGATGTTRHRLRARSKVAWALTGRETG